MTAIIDAHNLHRWYGHGDNAYHAVRGVNLTVDEGEVFALLGTNGAGKTSTLDLLEGLTSPDDGGVSVFGLDPVADRRAVRPDVGIMLQSGGLPAELTVSETLEMWRGTCSHPTTVDDVLAKVRLVDRADVRVRSLSGGEQRRVDLACALLGRPRLLFLDEPTTGLEPASRRDTWRLLSDLRADGVTMVLTTHYLDEAEALADRIAIMRDGVIATTGTLRDIVDDHPSTIGFDLPDAPLPTVDGLTVVGGRVSVSTRRLQTDLLELLTWADRNDIGLTGLTARSASLESVFLDLAGDSAQPDSAHPNPTQPNSAQSIRASR